MRNPFSSAASPLGEAEQALTKWGVEYKKNPDGTLVVHGNLNIASMGLTRLPDLSSVSVLGNFECNDNKLTSLEGAPRHVGGSYYCYQNLLTSLKGAPEKLDHHLNCTNNRLTSLEGAPQSVGGSFYCQHNQLSTLEYAPRLFSKLESDFGGYDAWSEVPEDLRLLPEKRAQALDDAVRAATVLQAPLQVRRPLSLRSMTHS